MTLKEAKERASAARNTLSQNEQVLTQRETELNQLEPVVQKAASQEIPQRKLGSGVTRETQQTVLENRQQARDLLPQIEQQREAIRTGREDISKQRSQLSQTDKAIKAAEVAQRHVYFGSNLTTAQKAARVSDVSLDAVASSVEGGFITSSGKRFIPTGSKASGGFIFQETQAPPPLPEFKNIASITDIASGKEGGTLQLVTYKTAPGEIQPIKGLNFAETKVSQAKQKVTNYLGVTPQQVVRSYKEGKETTLRVYDPYFIKTGQYAGQASSLGILKKAGSSYGITLSPEGERAYGYESKFTESYVTENLRSTVKSPTLTAATAFAFGAGSRYGGLVIGEAESFLTSKAGRGAAGKAVQYGFTGLKKGYGAAEYVLPTIYGAKVIGDIQATNYNPTLLGAELARVQNEEIAPALAGGYVGAKTSPSIELTLTKLRGKSYGPVTDTLEEIGTLKESYAEAPFGTTAKQLQAQLRAQTFISKASPEGKIIRLKGEPEPLKELPYNEDQFVNIYSAKGSVGSEFNPNTKKETTGVRLFSAVPDSRFLEEKFVVRAGTSRFGGQYASVQLSKEFTGIQTLIKKQAAGFEKLKESSPPLTGRTEFYTFPRPGAQRAIVEDIARLPEEIRNPIIEEGRISGYKGFATPNVQNAIDYAFKKADVKKAYILPRFEVRGGEIEVVIPPGTERIPTGNIAVTEYKGVRFPIIETKPTGERVRPSDLQTRVRPTAIVKTKEGILLTYSPEERKYVLPGGGVDAGEDINRALSRELLEETGLRLKSATPVGTVTGPVKVFGNRRPYYRYVEEQFVGFNVQAEGVAQPSGEVGKIAYYTPKSKIPISDVTKKLIALAEQNRAEAKSIPKSFGKDNAQLSVNRNTLSAQLGKNNLNLPKPSSPQGIEETRFFPERYRTPTTSGSSFAYPSRTTPRRQIPNTRRTTPKTPTYPSNPIPYKTTPFYPSTPQKTYRPTKPSYPRQPPYAPPATPPSFPPITYTPKTPKLTKKSATFDFPSFRARQKQTKITPRPVYSRGYTPSFISTAFGITRKVTQKQFNRDVLRGGTSIEVRPIPIIINKPRRIR